MVKLYAPTHWLLLATQRLAFQICSKECHRPEKLKLPQLWRHRSITRKRWNNKSQVSGVWNFCVWRRGATQSVRYLLVSFSEHFAPRSQDPEREGAGNEVEILSPKSGRKQQRSIMSCISYSATQSQHSRSEVPRLLEGLPIQLSKPDQ